MPITNRLRAEAALLANPTVQQESPTRTLSGRVLLALLATLVVAIASHIAFPLWFTPVPLTLQPLAVLGVGLALGPELGFFALCGYLLEGAAGLPVFSPTGMGGLRQLLGPTGGYLFAYPLVALLAGAVTRSLRHQLSPFTAALAGCTAATAVLFAVGTSWLGLWLHLPAAIAIHQGITPFLPGEALKIAAAAGTYRALSRRAH